VRKKRSLRNILLGRLDEPWGKKPLPQFLGLLILLGPGIVWAGFAQGSGELIWWPYVVAKYGLHFVGWLFIIASLQYWINLEIGRYTLATGETIFEGFHRLHHLFGWIMFLFVLIVPIWIGGYASGGATALAYLTKFPPGWSHVDRTRFWAEIIIILVLIIIILGPIIYKIIEGIEAVAALASFFGLLLVALLSPVVRSATPSYFSALFHPNWPLIPPDFDYEKDMEILITLIAYTGLGGIWNLLYSFWIREKNAGMAKYIGRITSPITGKPEPIPGIGYAFEYSTENKREWSKWMQWLCIDNAIGIILNTLTIILTTLLSFAILYPRGLVPEKFELVIVQAEWLGHLWGDLGRALLLLLALFFLIDSYLICLDGASRMLVSNLYSNIPKIRKVGYRTMYYIAVTIFTCIAMTQVLLQPPDILIILTGVINLFAMTLYGLALIVLNWYWLPKNHPAGAMIKPSKLTLAFLIIVVAIYWYIFYVLYAPIALRKIASLFKL